MDGRVNMMQAWRTISWVLREMVTIAPGRVALSVGLCLLLTFTEGAAVLLLPSLLELVGVMEENPVPNAAGWIRNGLSMFGAEASLGAVLMLFVALSAIRSLTGRVVARVVASMREGLVEVHRLRLYSAISGAEWRYLVTRTQSGFAHTLTSEIGRVGWAVTQITELIVLSLTALVYLLLALRWSPAMALLVLSSAAVLGWAMRGVLDRAGTLGATAAEARYRLHAAATTHLASIKTARSFGALVRHTGEFAGLSHDVARIGAAASVSESQLQQRLDVGSTILLAVIVYVSVAWFHVQTGLLLVVLYIFARVMPRLVQIYRIGQGLMTALPVVESVRAIERECVAAAEPSALAPRSLPFATEVVFERVSFSYLSRPDTGGAVEALDLRIAAGSTTAIVGASGSGKTTAADLLMGLLTPASGRILVDGVPLTRDVLDSWRSQIGYVPQDAFLFDESIRANLQWAKPAASEADLWEALGLASADRFVSQLPAGLDTLVGDRGVMLSGGERQRIGIARALLRTPRLLLLDEATSALDGESERRIKDAIETLRHRMTIVVITHRLSAIRDADQIYVMDRGRVVTSGSWAQVAGDSTRELMVPRT